MTDEPYALAHVMPTPPPGRRRAWVIPVIIGVIALVLIGGLAVFQVLRQSGFEVHGTLELSDDRGGWYGGNIACEGSGGYSDIRPGAQIVVSDAAGKTVALGQLGQGKASGASTCVFAVSIKGVPGGSDFYGIELTHRGVVRYTADEIHQDLHLTLGGTT